MYRLWEPQRLLLSVNNQASYGKLSAFGLEGMSGVALKHDV